MILFRVSTLRPVECAICVSQKSKKEWERSRKKKKHECIRISCSLPHHQSVFPSPKRLHSIPQLSTHLLRFILFVRSAVEKRKSSRPPYSVKKIYNPFIGCLRRICDKSGETSLLYFLIYKA